MVVGLGAAFLGLVGTLKALRSVATVITTFKTLSEAIKKVEISQKALNLVMKANVFILVASAIAGLVVALVQLYKHNKKFRAFVNGIGRGLKNMAKGFVNTGKSILKGADNLHKKLSRGWNNYWKEQGQKQRAYQKQEARNQRQRQKQDQQAWNSMKRNASRGWKNIEQNARSGANRVSRWYTNMNRSTSRVVQNMYRQHPRTFQSMYKVIEDRTRTWHDVTTGHWSRLKDDTGRLARDQSRANKDIFEDMYSAINKKTGGWLGKVVDSWRDHMSQIGDAISAGKRKAGQAMAGLANGVLKPFKTLIDDIQSGINWVLDKIGASKLGGSWSAAIPTFATGTAGNRDGLKKATIGMVNDGPGSHWRELYSYKGQVGAFPNKRNFITFLPKGMSILNGEDSHKLMSAIGLPKFADGIGNFFANLKDDVDDWTDQAEKIMAHPVEFMEHVFTKKLSGLSSGIKFAQSMITNVPIYVAKQMAKWVKKQFEDLRSADSPAGTMSKEAFAKAAHQAAESMHQSLSAGDIARLYWQAWDESNVNPAQGGGIDDHDGTGRPIGLFQFKLSTWNSAVRAMGGRHSNIHSAVDQIAAVLADRTWRSDLAPIGVRRGWTPHGYANGGLVNVESLAHVAEGNRPEMIIPLTASKRGRAYQLLSEVMAQFKHEDGPAQPTRDDQSISRKEFMSLESKLDQLISGVQQLVQVGQQQIDATINSGNKLGLKSTRSTLYNAMGKDQRVSNYMSY